MWYNFKYKKTTIGSSGFRCWNFDIIDIQDIHDIKVHVLFKLLRLLYHILKDIFKS